MENIKYQFLILSALLLVFTSGFAVPVPPSVNPPWQDYMHKAVDGHLYAKAPKVSLNRKKTDSEKQAG